MSFAHRLFRTARFFAPAAVLSTIILSACSAGSSLPPPTPVGTPMPVLLASASNSTCVPAQNTPQSVTMPDTAGVNLTVNLAKFAGGGTGCQNISIATGSAAATNSVATNVAVRRTTSTSQNPLISVTLGQSLPSNSNLGLTSVLSGATIQTDSNVVFPDGTYNATITLLEFNSPITYSLVFTASGGKLTITGGNALPLTLGQGAVIKIFDRGVIPDGFLIGPSPTPTINPSATPTATASPGPTATIAPTPTASPEPTTAPTLAPGQTIADGTQIGSYTTILSGYPSNLSYINGVTIHGTITYGTDAQPQCTLDDPTHSQNETCNTIGASFGALSEGTGFGFGTTSYNLGQIGARSFRVNGCAGRITYGGSGSTGTFSLPYTTAALAVSDSCEVDLFSQPANIINADPMGGYQYLVYTLSGPVSQGAGAPYPAAENTH